MLVLVREGFQKSRHGAFRLGAPPSQLIGRSRAKATVASTQRVDERTKDFAPYEQIKYIHLLPKELSQEAGELTPTLKVKRRVVTERYAREIESLYEMGGVQKLSTHGR